MKTLGEHKEAILVLKSKTSTIEDLTLLLNVCKDDLYGEHSGNPIQKKSISYYSDNRISKKKYKQFNVAKKSVSVLSILKLSR